MITGTVSYDLREAAKVIGVPEKDVPAISRRVARAFLNVLVRRVVKTKLTGQVLNRVTGTLIRDVTASPTIRKAGDVIVGTMGTSLAYGAAHEEGFSGTVSVPAHEVKAHKIKAHTRRQWTSAGRGGGSIGKSVKVRAHQVRAHTRRAHTKVLNLRARRYLRSTFNELLPEVGDMAGQALFIKARTGRLPRVAELASGRA